MNMIQFNGKVVVETHELAQLYGKTSTDIMNTYSQNKSRFVEGEHYYRIESHDKKCVNDDTTYLWTEQGLYEHAVLMKGKCAWHSYCQFIYFVFNQSDEVKQAMGVLRKAEDMISKEKFLYSLGKEFF